MTGPTFDQSLEVVVDDPLLVAQAWLTDQIRLCAEDPDLRHHEAVATEALRIVRQIRLILRDTHADVALARTRLMRLSVDALAVALTESIPVTGGDAA